MLREHVRTHHSGPDPKCVGSATPYLCKVCSESFATPEEVVKHIVQHCDDNTALRRQPQTGPRKYKRRRKLKPHETNTMVRRNEFTYDMTDADSGAVAGASNTACDAASISGVSGGGGAAGGSDSEDNTKRKLGKKNKQRSNVEEGYQNVLKSFESSLQNINSIVSNSKLNVSKSKVSKKKLRKEDKKQEAQTSSQSSRPKMIHTQKTRVPVELGSDGAKKGQKTKTMVTRTPKVMPNEHKSGAVPGGERNRPRTKNVSYHVEGKMLLTPATFPARSVKDEIALSAQQVANIKQEPGMQKTAHDSYKNNNGNIVVKSQESTPNASKRKTASSRKPKRQKQVTVKQEVNTSVEANTERQQLQLHNNNNNITGNSGDSAQLMEPVVDGSHLEVAFEASVVTAQEEEDDHVDEGSILRSATTEISNSDVKLSVKVEPAPSARMLAVHSVIASVDDVPETIIPDAVEYTCEMCAAVFSSRAELLVHVPIHI